MKRARMVVLAAALAIAAIGALAWLRRRRASDEPRATPSSIAVLREAVERDPKSAEAHYALGLAFLRAGDADGAVAEIEAALSLAPPDASWRPEAEDAFT